MIRHALLGFALVAALAWASLAQQPASPGGQAGQVPPPDAHPQVGHPMMLKPGPDWPKAEPKDVATPEAVVAAYYASTSGKPGQARDWTRFRSLFHPQARLIPARPTGDGGASAFFLSVEEYIQQNQKYFEKSGFIDAESARRIDSFGNIVHVWSTYESRRSEGDAEPYSRGIASIQLLKDNDRWWIMNVFWDFERPNMPVPEKYRKSPKD